MPSAPLSARFLQLNDERFIRWLAPFCFRAAHISRGLTRLQQLVIRHLAETFTQLVDVEFREADSLHYGSRLHSPRWQRRELITIEHRGHLMSDSALIGAIRTAPDLESLRKRSVETEKGTDVGTTIGGTLNGGKGVPGRIGLKLGGISMKHSRSWGSRVRTTWVENSSTTSASPYPDSFDSFPGSGWD
jgi:hypothetical protein